MHARYILKVTCPDQPGIVAFLSNLLYRLNCNIEEAHQFSDPETGLFFCRLALSVPTEALIPEIHTQLAAAPQSLHLSYDLIDTQKKLKTLILVSKFGHCLNDLLFRFQQNQLNMSLAGVASNHTTFQALVEQNNLPFHHIPISKQTKQDAEAKLLSLVTEQKIDLIILARYMQILSDSVCEKLSGKIINIHHSFLPSFKGAKPYHQAHQKGVKLIGATAHYVTADLDEGPIIEQEVQRVTHAATPQDLVQAGQDIESLVLSRALKYHLDHRVFLNGHKTIIFR